MNDLFASNSASLTTTIVFALALAMSLLLKFWLASRQIRHVAQNRDAVPTAFAEKINIFHILQVQRWKHLDFALLGPITLIHKSGKLLF